MKRRVLQPPVSELSMRVWFWYMNSMPYRLPKGEIGLQYSKEEATRFCNKDTASIGTTMSITLESLCSCR